MQFSEFVGSATAQQRYWARSFVGWERMSRAAPNRGHRALVNLEESGLQGVISQNVDGLHTAAGSSSVIHLHGEIGSVLCLDCGDRTARADLQERLARLNPQLVSEPVPGSVQLRPDGDAAVHDWHTFGVAGCLVCGGRLKPDVVFFGESVPKPRVQRAYDLLDSAEVLLVAGSSLTVMSGLRFVRSQAKRSLPVIIVNRGATRGDEFATIKLDAGCSETLEALHSVI